MAVIFSLVHTFDSGLRYFGSVGDHGRVLSRFKIIARI